ncbi:MAG: hypothetical protein K2K85_07135 [Clostridia bacterium]|nr:hypothetical protein [Clostridia bacterium]
MTKNKKIVIATVSAIVAPIVILLIVLSGFIIAFEIDILQNKIKHKGWNEIDYCNECWEMQIPNATIEYNFSNCGGFLGDGTEYTVCRYSTRPDEFLKDFEPDCNDEYITIYNRILPLMQYRNSQGVFIDNEKLFTPDNNFIWQSKIKNGNCTLLLAYNEQNNTLYIIENFM